MMRKSIAGAMLGVFVGIVSHPAFADGGDDDYAKPDISGGSSQSQGSGGGSLFGLFGSDDSTTDESGTPVKVISRYRHGSLDAIVLDSIRSKTMGQLRTNGHGIVPDEKLTQYLQGIVDRIVKHSPEPSLRVRVVVRATNAFNAEAYPGWLMSVPVGLLRDLKTEDELAFVLAHELAHVLFRHHDSDWLKNLEHKVFFAASVAGAFAEQYAKLSGNNEAASKIKRVRLISKGLYEVTDHALNPAWNREQEVEADKVGLDLLVSAGYQPSAVQTYFATLAESEKRARARKLADRQEQERAAEEAVNSAVKDKGVFAGVKEVFSHGIDQATTGLKDEFGDKHYPAEERQKTLLAYEEKVYAEPEDERYTELQFGAEVKPLPWSNWNDEKIDKEKEPQRLVRSYREVEDALDLIEKGEFKAAEKILNKAVYKRTTDHSYHRHVFFQLRKKQNKNKYAWINLEKAIHGRAASVPIYQVAIDLRLEQNEPDVALSLLERARTDLDDPIYLWPTRIGVMVRLGREKEIQSLILECNAESAELGEECEKAVRLAREANGAS